MNLIVLLYQITPVYPDGKSLGFPIFINPQNISEIVPVVDTSKNDKVTHACIVMSSGSRHFVEGEPAKVVAQMDSRIYEKTKAFAKGDTGPG